MTEEGENRLEATAKLYDEAAGELEGALAHCRIAAGHFRAGEIPRGAAHAWAAYGHVLVAKDTLEAQAREHRERSRAN